MLIEYKNPNRHFAYRLFYYLFSLSFIFTLISWATKELLDHFIIFTLNGLEYRKELGNIIIFIFGLTVLLYVLYPLKSLMFFTDKNWKSIKSIIVNITISFIAIYIFY